MFTCSLSFADSQVNLGHTAITTSVVPVYAAGVLLSFNTVSSALCMFSFTASSINIGKNKSSWSFNVTELCTFEVLTSNFLCFWSFESEIVCKRQPFP